MATKTTDGMRFALTHHPLGLCLRAYLQRSDGVWYGVDASEGSDLETIYRELRGNLRCDGFTLGTVVLMRGQEPSPPFHHNQLLRRLRHQAEELLAA